MVRRRKLTNLKSLKHAGAAYMASGSKTRVRGCQSGFCPHCIESLIAVTVAFSGFLIPPRPPLPPPRLPHPPRHLQQILSVSTFKQQL